MRAGEYKAMLTWTCPVPTLEEIEEQRWTSGLQPAQDFVLLFTWPLRDKGWGSEVCPSGLSLGLQ